MRLSDVQYCQRSKRPIKWDCTVTLEPETVEEGLLDFHPALESAPHEFRVQTRLGELIKDDSVRDYVSWSGSTDVELRVRGRSVGGWISRRPDHPLFEKRYETAGDEREYAKGFWSASVTVEVTGRVDEEELREHLDMSALVDHAHDYLSGLVVQTKRRVEAYRAFIHAGNVVTWAQRQVSRRATAKARYEQRLAGLRAELKAELDIQLKAMPDELKQELEPVEVEYLDAFYGVVEKRARDTIIPQPFGHDSLDPEAFLDKYDTFTTEEE